MKLLKPTWRWFGPEDPVTLQDIRQTDATGIVTALHQIPHGAIWPVEEIAARKQLIEDAGLTWDVVESVTVHESIKTQTGNYQDYIEKYKQTLRNLASCGIRIVTYNFMPVLDWVRTNISYRLPNGAEALYFDRADLALFDIHLLERENAARDHDPAVVEEAARRWQYYSAAQKQAIADTILLGIPSEKKLDIPGIRERLSHYANITREQLQQHLKYFLEQVTPVAAQLDMKLAIHPDDPPFDVLGLPRIVTGYDDIAFILNAVDNPANGICYCTGSLGAGVQNDLPAILQMIGNRVHFVHLRNVQQAGNGNFFEADHLQGDVDMYAVMKILLELQQQQPLPIPFRPDHGHRMLDDQHKHSNPGYSAIGRMKGLAALIGLELGIARAQQ
ncbi:mannonate dehydratase [Chitinophaga agrisoli]|uniref:Mannonate dehydratase n=1 Tax=Chitinophaga agrisoli TaxID=2607653 RepID=A0A5B2W2R7_9BACT|nr:mannonate dehydratase [Chitinophaga agrisoli]KAA2244796.1 mannonate dehydratase [Chitinophaga agrisoli]